MIVRETLIDIVPPDIWVLSDHWILLVFVEKVCDAAGHLMVDWVVVNDTRVHASVEEIVSEGIQLLRRQSRCIVLFLEHSSESAEVLGQERNFEELDSLIWHDEDVSWLDITMEETVSIESSTAVGDSSDDVPHFRLGHPFTRIISGKSLSPMELLAQVFF